MGAAFFFIAFLLVPALGGGREPRIDRWFSGIKLGLGVVGLGVFASGAWDFLRVACHRRAPAGSAGRKGPGLRGPLFRLPVGLVLMLQLPLLGTRGVAHLIPTDTYIGLIERRPHAWRLGDWWEVMNRPLAPRQADRLVDTLVRVAGPDEPFMSGPAMRVLLPKASPEAVQRYLRAAWEVEILAPDAGPVEVRACSASRSAARLDQYPKVLLGPVTIDGEVVHPAAAEWASPTIGSGVLPERICLTLAAFRVEPADDEPRVLRAEYWIVDVLEAGWPYLEGQVWTSDGRPDTAGGLLSVSGPHVVEREFPVDDAR